MSLTEEKFEGLPDFLKIFVQVFYSEPILLKQFKIIPYFPDKNIITYPRYLSYLFSSPQKCIFVSKYRCTTHYLNFINIFRDG